MYPYFDSTTPMMPLAFPVALTNRGIYDYDLPEEVRIALAERENEIHDEEDARRIAEELMLRR